MLAGLIGRQMTGQRVNKALIVQKPRQFHGEVPPEFRRSRHHYRGKAKEIEAKSQLIAKFQKAVSL